MMDCNEAAKLIDKSDFKKLSFSQKMGLKFHKFMCKACRGYAKDSHLLRRLVTKVFSKQQCLSCEEKETMKKEIAS